MTHLNECITTEDRSIVRLILPIHVPFVADDIVFLIRNGTNLEIDLARKTCDPRFAQLAGAQSKSQGRQKKFESDSKLYSTNYPNISIVHQQRRDGIHTQRR
jgi:hypothetical protein